MEILLVISFAFTLVFIGFMMSKLDKFLLEKGFSTEPDNRCPAAIVLGETMLAEQVEELLSKDGFKVFSIKEPFIMQKGQNFQYVFALSESDADNIVLCRIGKKVYCIEKSISICNESANENMFINEKILFIKSEKATAKVVYHSLINRSEVKL